MVLRLLSYLLAIWKGYRAQRPRAKKLGIILRYILETSRANPAEVRGLLARQLGRKAAEEIMTTADMLRSEGRREGRREGEAKGMKKGAVLGQRGVLLRQLRRRFGELPASAVDRIEQASPAELNRWADRVLTAESLAEVLGTKARRTA